MHRALIAANVGLIGASIVHAHHDMTHMPSFLYKRMAPATVLVESVGSKRNPFDINGERVGVPRGAGTGFYVHPPNHLISKRSEIVTNYHVIEDSEIIVIRSKDGAPPLIAHVVSADPVNDVAVLETEESADDLTTNLVLCNRDPIIGEDVLAIGNPYGLDKSLSAGVVSGLGRSVGGVLPNDMIQTDAVINPGNSGGPLISRKDACVLGVNTATINQSSGIGFAVKGDIVKRRLLSHLQK